MVTIKDWFKTKDYETGLALLSKASKNRVLLLNLHKKKNMGKLEYELRKLARKKNVKISSPVKVSPGNKIVPIPKIPGEKLTIIRGNQEINYKDLPDVIKILYDAVRDAYKEMRALHEKLKLLEKASDKDRQPLTSRIIHLHDVVRKNWEKIDNWQSGTDPAPEPTPPKVEIDTRRINSNRKYISTNLRKLQEGALNPDKQEYVRGEILKRFLELKSAGFDMNQQTVEELIEVGIEI